MTPLSYRFGEFRLDSAARELWHGDRLVTLPRRIFDALVYLIEHRDRAVGRDELIGALWGRVDVADVQVSQLILRVRHTIGDDSHSQHAIRTVSGFGYRWVMTTEAMTPRQGATTDDPSHSVDDSHALAAETLTAPVPALAGIDVRAATPTPTTVIAPGRRRSQAIALAALCILSGAVVLAYFHRTAPEATTEPMPDDTSQTVAVLPLEISAPDSSSWVRLGAMDLIAARLRRGGLPVAPSESVLAALQASATSAQAYDEKKVRHLLGAGLIVQGRAIASPRGWRVELSTREADGVRHRVEAEQTDVTDAARKAADLLLAALGRNQPIDASETRDDVEDRVQRARAALLANKLEATRAILTQGPATERNDPRIRALLALVDYRAGRIEQTRAALLTMDGDPMIAAQPLAHGQILMLLGFIEVRSERWAPAERYFDQAVSVLRDQRQSREAGIALAARGVTRGYLRRFDAALDDLARAGPRLLAAGDRQGIARVNNYLGHLEMVRDRPAEAVPYFIAAANSQESFGDVDALRANLSALFLAQARLLRWQDALSTSERLWRLRERIDDPAMQFSIAGFRARALLAVGRLREAESVLVATQSAWPQARSETARTLHEARTELAWLNGGPEQVIAAAREVLQSSIPDDDRARGALLLQRASIATGQATPADTRPTVADLDKAANGVDAITEDGPAMALLVAKAEWAAHRRHHAEAERGFRHAQKAAEASGVAADIALVAQAYAHWLLARGRVEDASAVAGRIAPWADRDFDSALLQVAVFHADGQHEPWARALHQAQRLAGERRIPPALLMPPAMAASPSPPIAKIRP